MGEINIGCALGSKSNGVAVGTVVTKGASVSSATGEGINVTTGFFVSSSIGINVLGDTVGVRAIGDGVKAAGVGVVDGVVVSTSIGALLFSFPLPIIPFFFAIPFPLIS